MLLEGETGSGRAARAHGPRAIIAHARPHASRELRRDPGGDSSTRTLRSRAWKLHRCHEHAPRLDSERADGGTLFLDEVGELSLAAQVRLLRVLQDGTLERVGGGKSIRVDVRVITATQQPPRNVRAKAPSVRISSTAIGVFTVRIPPLRDRRDDIPALASHFAQARRCAPHGRPAGAEVRQTRSPSRTTLGRATFASSWRSSSVPPSLVSSRKPRSPSSALAMPCALARTPEAGDPRQ